MIMLSSCTPDPPPTTSRPPLVPATPAPLSEAGTAEGTEVGGTQGMAAEGTEGTEAEGTEGIEAEGTEGTAALPLCCAAAGPAAFDAALADLRSCSLRAFSAALAACTPWHRAMR
eukprot:145219-Pelagomonas_calceolata.AAC.8